MSLLPFLLLLCQLELLMPRTCKHSLKGDLFLLVNIYTHYVSILMNDTGITSSRSAAILNIEFDEERLISIRGQVRITPLIAFLRIIGRLLRGLPQLWTLGCV